MSFSEDELFQKIKTLNESIWEGRVPRVIIDDWLNNFTRENSDIPKERFHALFLLSNFMYFGSQEIRELLKALFRDLYKYPVIEEIRKSNMNTIDMILINKEFQNILKETLFMGVGNPSESGSHLLYYFRQENALDKNLFIHTHQIFRGRREDQKPKLRFPNVSRYIFIDDFCGTGDQATSYFENLLVDIKTENSSAFIAYYMLFATSDGLSALNKIKEFDSVQCIFELDSTFKCFDSNSRFFSSSYPDIEINFAKDMCRFYGSNLFPSDPLGYGDCQLLLGFHHNVPDNTLPILWSDEQSWEPVFKRYPKFSSWLI